MDSLKYTSLAELVALAQARKERISDVVIIDQAAQAEDIPQALYDKMLHNYQVMMESIDKGTDPNLKSTSGLTGGDAAKLHQAYQRKRTLTGSFMSGAIWRALAVSELNASMGRIVAAPTAGSCGILPAAVATMREEHNISEFNCVMSLFTASAVGMVIANNASLAGASGGCQAECGSASAMAAAAIVEMAGGSPEMVDHAVAIVLKCTLGLVCDPVAGLVEIPCIKRNASGVTTAFMAAEMALAGITSHIPADEVIVAMKRVGDLMPVALRETADGGLATTPTGEKLRRQVFGDGPIVGCACKGPAHQ
ncbi:MAG: L-serine ammonia-lyase, iron-sulfur-dependent, subunit alpha [Peptococcaceae bacterium]|nr:L-serine ammonia-lyase, iron-sulfur-dependent, subunit alpha [Peptococcaceae bacterium]